MLEPQAEDLDKLRLQAEWVEVPIYFRLRLESVRERMTTIGIESDELQNLAVRGAVYRELLEWALRAPEKERKDEIGMA